MTPRPQCAIPDCPAPVFRAEWCARHWHNWDVCGDPSHDATPEDRFWEQVDKDGPLIAARPDLGPCWLWTGTLERGYGRTVLHGKRTFAHRLTYEMEIGPLPEGLVSDHLCHTLDPDCKDGPRCPHRACCNPQHVEFVTQRENVHRGRGFSGENARKTHCKYGHEFTPENTWVNPKSEARQCRTCFRMRSLARYWERTLNAAS